MSILAECPICHLKQKVQNRICTCGADLAKTKRSSKVRYWITYRLPGGKQRREPVGYSIEEARDADGKRRSQKRENRIFDVVPEAKMKFEELIRWYLELESVKKLKSFDRIEGILEHFIDVFGTRLVNSFKIVDFENYQVKRANEKKAPATIDMEITIVKTMITKAFDNDLVGGQTLKVFKKLKKKLKKNANVRDRILSKDECSRFLTQLPPHTKAIVALAIYTGMRKGEILSLTWDKVDLQKGIIRLESTDTKDNEPRKIPILKELHPILNNIPRAIHDNHVILYKGKPIKRDIRAALRTGCRKAGISYGRFVRGAFIFHDTRHTYNTNMRKAGAEQSVIMKITGHSTNDMFNRYNTIDEDDIKKAAEKMDMFLESVDQNVDQDTPNTTGDKQERLAITVNPLKLHGGSAWESNPPETVLAPHTEFEVREAHQ